MLRDSDLLELMEIIRQIPRERWELFSYIRTMDQGDIERIKRLISPSSNVQDPQRRISPDIDDFSDEDVDYSPSDEAGPVNIDDIRKYL